MVENAVIQMRGFHNLYDENGGCYGFTFCMRTKYYKGIFLSQLRCGDVTADDEVFPAKDIIWEIDGVDYKPTDLTELGDVYWQVNDIAVIKVKKPNGLSQGYHDIDIKYGYNCNYMDPKYTTSELAVNFAAWHGIIKRRLLIV
jgi:hypothetical protein